ncbi:MAG: DUF4358 domain-containing protein [Eubacterium sp.]|nr:DUF4358 domain-containing protein [Eubacterium sp.]
MKKKSYLSLTGIILALALCLCACSGGGKAAAVSLYDLKNAMAGATQKFSEMTYASSKDEGAQEIFANISDLSYSKVDSFCIYYATNGTGNADEIAVIQVKNNNDLTDARKSLEAHLEKRKSLYSTYDKTQLKKLDGARVVTAGNCAALIVGDEADKISEAFYGFFNGE